MEEAIECWLSVLDNLGRVKDVAIKPKITRMTTSISSKAIECKEKQQSKWKGIGCKSQVDKEYSKKIRRLSWMAAKEFTFLHIVSI